MYKRLAGLVFLIAVMFSSLYIRIFAVMKNEEYKQAGMNQGTYTLDAGVSYGNIYDRNLRRLNNRTYRYFTAINPTAEAVKEILPFVSDKTEFYKKLQYGKPFVCETTKSDFESCDIESFVTPVRESENQTACHVVGYTSEGKGVSGLEYAFNDYLSSEKSVSQVTYRINAKGAVIEGMEKERKENGEVKSGIITTLDTSIQDICEKAGETIEKGAIVVSEVGTGEILAMASFPSYNVNQLAKEMHNENSPMINRTLSAYCVGSAFKLAVSAAAIESGLEGFEYDCKGSIKIGGQVFRCHNIKGHGLQDMNDATVNSCNCYFIALGQKIESEKLLNVSSALGYGREFVLADGIVSSRGNLQTKDDIEIMAEKANFSFGQGKLLATPLQVNLMTATIANNGIFVQPKLIIGKADENNFIEYEELPQYNEVRAIEETTALKLRNFMVNTVQGNPLSLARPQNTTAGGKTSTAQTGRYDDNNTELCNAWITGFFPAENPRYAVTVLVEDGGSGNITASPIFRQIAEQITLLGTQEETDN